MGSRVFEDVIHPEDRSRVISHFGNLIKTNKEEVTDTEVRIRHKNGTWRWHLIRDTVFFRDESGKIVQMIAVGTDITKRKSMEEEIRELNRTLEEKVAERTRELRESEEILRQRENLLRLIANSIPAFISYIDSHQIYRFANSFYQNINGVEGGDIKGKHLKDVFSEAFYSRVQNEIKEALSGKKVSFESEILMKMEQREFLILLLFRIKMRKEGQEVML